MTTGQGKPAQSVLIVGASIAGPALAYCLHEYGYAVTIVERASELRPGGQAVDVRGIGKDVLRRMGLYETIWNARTGTEKLSYVTRRNKEVATLTSTQFDGDGFIAEIEVLRGDMAEALYDVTKDFTEYIFGEQVAALQQDATGVDVTLTSGTKRRFDLVVGADGLHSGVRSLVFGPESDLVKYQGTCLAFFSAPNHMGLNNVMIGYNESGLGGGIRAIDNNEGASVLFGFNGDNTEYRLSRDEQKALVRKKVSRMRWKETATLLDYMDAADDFYLDSVSVVEMDCWSNGRVTLVGDAACCACPASGQGTIQAVIGAYILAGELALAQGDHTRALAQYESRMRPWALANQKDGKKNVKYLTPRNTLDVVLLYSLLWLLPKLPARNRVLGQMLKNIWGIDPPDYGNMLRRAAAAN